MSKELEMLRAMVAVDHLRGGEKFEVPKTAGQASWVWRMTHLDLRAILARMEAAERVCEAAKESRKVDADLRVGAAGMMNVKAATEALDDALRAYRAFQGDQDAK